MTWLKRVLRLMWRTNRSEYERGVREAKLYKASHSSEECKMSLGHAICDRDMSEGVDKAFAIGWIQVTRQKMPPS